MKLLGRRVLVVREKTQESYGSIVIPEQARTKPQQGLVSRIGPQVTTVMVGDRVLFGKHAALEVDGVGVLLWEQDIMVVLDHA